jgi:hypothetical protein
MINKAKPESLEKKRERGGGVGTAVGICCIATVFSLERAKT